MREKREMKEGRRMNKRMAGIRSKERDRAN